MLRSSTCLDHGGWGDSKIAFDPEEDIVAIILTAAYNESFKPKPKIFGPILNILYSSLE
jgi:CubicO group peptidase (beta-lactamase class C family)